MAKSQAADGDAIHGKQCLHRTLEPACHGSDGCLGSVRALESCEEPEIYIRYMAINSIDKSGLSGASGLSS